MSTDTRLDPGGFVLRFAFSAVHGLLLYAIYYAITEGAWFGKQPAVFIPLLSLLLVLPGTYYLTVDLARTRGYRRPNDSRRAQANLARQQPLGGVFLLQRCESVRVAVHRPQRRRRGGSRGTKRRREECVYAWQ